MEDPLQLEKSKEYIKAANSVAKLNEKMFEIQREMQIKYPYYRFEISCGELLYHYEGMHKLEDLTFADLLEI